MTEHPLLGRLRLPLTVSYLNNIEIKQFTEGLLELYDSCMSYTFRLEGCSKETNAAFHGYFLQKLFTNQLRYIEAFYPRETLVTGGIQPAMSKKPANTECLISYEILSGDYFECTCSIPHCYDAETYITYAKTTINAEICPFDKTFKMNPQRFSVSQ